nr:HAD-IIIC family phosphatase [Phocaeicola paurosaccharolyticus]
MNLELMSLAQQYSNLFICDIASIQNKFGRDFMFDSTVYVSTEMILSIDALPYVAFRTLDIICSIEGKFKKCLILDLDNTVWGGVVGDDGWENIQVGHSLGIGKAFSEFQQWVKKLKNRGIIVCVCSKNDEDKAKEPFVKNPEMVLKLDDISVFVANWDNKADNIRSIQSVLNISFDSMVFLDDNPFERNLVRENIPEISVPELPVDPGEYLEFLYTLNLFETASYSSADKDRTKQYQVEAQRASTSKKFTNESDFLKSLNMGSEVSGFTSFNTPRVAQLSQRSNQFNLRTIRYTEDQIIAIENDPNQKGFAFSLEDKFGDNGLIAVVILQNLSSIKNHSVYFRNITNHEQNLFIDSWFMSCRVLKRSMENFTLNTIVAWAKENGYKKIIGEYLPTQKNGMVAEHYTGLGFIKLKGSESSLFELDVETYLNRECFINVK